jgi:Domain of unknown function (DUF4376)
MNFLPMSIADVGILSSSYSDKDQWQRIYYDGTNLCVPDDLLSNVQSINLAIARKQNLVNYAMSKRWQKEVGGIIYSGILIATDDRSKQMILGARVAADADPEFTATWVTADNSVHNLVASDIISISNAVLAHIANCFATYVTVSSQITLETITQTEEVDAAFAAMVE